MAKTMLKYAFVTMIGAIALLLIALLFTNWRFPQQSTGKLVFAETYVLGTQFNRIEITTPQDKVTLIRQGDYWVIKEYDNYFADINILNQLLIDFSRSTYYSELPFSEQNLEDAGLGKEGTLVQTFVDDRLLDSVVVGAKAANGQYRFIRPQGKDEIWLADGDYILPAERYSWIMQPIEELPAEMVESIEENDIVVKRDNPKLPFLQPNGWPAPGKPLLDMASYITAENVMSAQFFIEDDYPKRRHLKFTTFQGLVAEYDLYANDQETWLKITLSATPLPKQEVNAYIKDNGIFYDNWYFKMPETQGKMLFLLPLIPVRQ